jgi:hypothetical protein
VYACVYHERDDTREKEEKKRLERVRGGVVSVRLFTYHNGDRRVRNTALKVLKEWPLVLLGKVGF